MTRRRAHILDAALDDIDEIVRYTVNEFGERQAERYAETIDMAIAEIANDPRTLRARHRADVHPDARTIHISRRGRRASQLLLYRIRSDGTVEIARVLHDSMELRRHLPADFGTDAEA